MWCVRGGTLSARPTDALLVNVSQAKGDAERAGNHRQAGDSDEFDVPRALMDRSRKGEQAERSNGSCGCRDRVSFCQVKPVVRLEGGDGRRVVIH